MLMSQLCGGFVRYCDLDVVLDLENVVGLLIAAEMYELAALREICKSFVLYHAHEVFRNPQIVELPEKLLLEVLCHDVDTLGT